MIGEIFVEDIAVQKVRRKRPHICLVQRSYRRKVKQRLDKGKRAPRPEGDIVLRR